MYLSDNDISDITPLSKLITLEELGLYKNDITDVTPLFGLVNLKKLELFDNPISDKDIQALKKALPNCEIILENPY